MPEVASSNLRTIVSELARNGFPRSVTPWEADFLFGETERQLLVELARLNRLEMEAQRLYASPTKNNVWWSLRLEIRRVLQEGLLHGLGAFRSMVQNAIEYGAIPDPTTGWRYFRLPDGWYACWSCGSEVITDDLVAGSRTMRAVCPCCDDPDIPSGSFSYLKISS